MYEPDFRSSWAKIERATHHRDAFDLLLKTIIEDKTHYPVLGVKFKPETGHHAVYVSQVPSQLATALEQCALFLGDIFHNLRSALDHLVFQLALKNTNGAIEVESRVQFPIEDKMSTFDRRCIARSPRDPGAWIAEVHRDDQAIIRRFQPDGGPDGGLLLQHLRDYSNTDKHRLLTPVTIFSENILGGQDITALTVAMMHFQQASGTALTLQRAVLGAELFDADLGTEIKIEVEVAGYVTPNVVLDFGDRSAKPVPSIDKIVAEVEQVMRKFDPVS